MTVSTDTAQWFQPTGKCRGCGKNATGLLMSDRNGNLGTYCEPCANRRIKACHKLKSFLPDYTVAPAQTAGERS